MRKRLSFLLPSLVSLLVGCKPPPSASSPPSETSAEATEAGGAEASAETPHGEASTAQPGETVPLPAAEDVLAKAVEAVGGQAKLDAIETYYLESVMKVVAQNITATNKLWWSDGRFFALTEMPNVGVTKVWGNDDALWSEDPINGRRKLTGVEAAQTRWGNALVLAADWRRYFTAARTQARREDEGKILIDVVLTSADGDEVILSFDEASGLLLEQEYKQVTPTGSMPVHIDYEEYQVLDGLKVPTRSVMDLSLLKAETTLIKLQTNVEIDPSRLEPPTTETTEAPSKPDATSMIGSPR